MKFNLSTSAVKETTNHMGATAYRLTPEMELYTAVATCMVDDSYYENQEERISRIRQLIAQCSPEFVAKLAIYTRKEMNLRSIPVVLAVELAKAATGNNLISKTINNIVQRADEIKEILAYYQTKKCGASTERGIFEYMDKLISAKTIVDRIIIFSDCQVGAGCGWYDTQGNKGDNFDKLLKQYLVINPTVKVYSVDLQGYGNSLTRAENKNTILVSGWSEKIFDMIYYMENGLTVVDQINHIEL
jgi:hypothetical protein